MDASSSALGRAIAGANALKAGTWDAVTALSLLAIETHDRAFLTRAQDVAARLKGPMTWDGVSAMTVLARAERVLG